MMKGNHARNDRQQPGHHVYEQETDDDRVRPHHGGGLVLAVPSAMAQTKERHPKIRAAIVALEAARTEMKEAAHDFGGHRVAALASCDEAIKQLQEALKYDPQ